MRRLKRITLPEAHDAGRAIALRAPSQAVAFGAADGFPASWVPHAACGRFALLLAFLLVAPLDVAGALDLDLVVLHGLRKVGVLVDAVVERVGRRDEDPEGLIGRKGVGVFADPLTDGLEICCVFNRPGLGGAMCVCCCLVFHRRLRSSPLRFSCLLLARMAPFMFMQ